MKRFISVFFLGVLLISMFNITPKQVNAEESFDTALETYLGHAPSEEEKGIYSLIITTLKADGCSDYAIAGLIGNLEHESGGSLYVIEGYYGSKKTTCGKTVYQFEPGNSYIFEVEPSWTNGKGDNAGKTMGGEGHGLLQWSFGRADNLSKVAEEFPHVVVTHWKKSWNGTKNTHTCKIPNLAGQVAFICQELNSSSYKAVKDDMNAATTIEDAAKIFCQRYEIPANRYEESTWGPRATAAEKFYPVVMACQGLSGEISSSNGTTVDNANQIATYLTKKGYWEEKQLSSYCKLAEMNMQEILDKATKEDLDSKDLTSLEGWVNNVDELNQNSGWIKAVRVTVQVIGVILLLWSVLLFLGFQFDRINNIIDISIVTILTFGRLQVATDADESLKKSKETKTKLITKRSCLAICLVTSLFAVLLLTGKFYSILTSLVYTILNIFR